MLRKSSLKYSASLAVLLLGLSGQSATAADLTFSDGQTLTGIGAVDGVDSISYADAGGNPIDFTLDAVGTFTIGIDTNSIDGDEGAGVSTNTNVVNLVVGSGGGALDLIVSGNVVADGHRPVVENLIGWRELHCKEYGFTRLGFTRTEGKNAELSIS